MIVSFRRYYLDEALSAETFNGDVLDVGGKKSNPRGTFRPPLNQVRSWKYLSIDPETKPDYCCSAESIPLPEAQFDQVVLCEVVEHLENPSKVLSECYRVLRPQGRLIMTIPFLYGVHPDPSDFQRWTPQKINLELENLGFKRVETAPMGGLIAVFMDLFEMYCYLEFERKKRLPLWMKGLRFGLRRVLLRPLLFFDKGFSFRDFITTGYYIVACK